MGKNLGCEKTSSNDSEKVQLGLVDGGGKSFEASDNLPGPSRNLMQHHCK